MQIQYLEMVTHNVDATSSNYAEVHAVTFTERDQRLGSARTASFRNGGMIGIRAPMHETETPVVRAYMLVKDIEQAFATALEAGGEVVHPPLEIPRLGKFTIYILGGNHRGLWQM